MVSLDYIKSERRREAFQRFCPEFVIVDEAHTCTQAGQGRHQAEVLTRRVPAPAGNAAVAKHPQAVAQPSGYLQGQHKSMTGCAAR